MELEGGGLSGAGRLRLPFSTASRAVTGCGNSQQKEGAKVCQMPSRACRHAEIMQKVVLTSDIWSELSLAGQPAFVKCCIRYCCSSNPKKWLGASNTWHRLDLPVSV
jgi:hypothetical protein